jgi:hypothetical protein
MRTTVTLDPDVENYVRQACRARGKSFKKVLNEALRTALKPSTPVVNLLPPRAMGLQPGIDPYRLSELADELETESWLAAESARGYGKKRGCQ